MNHCIAVQQFSMRYALVRQSASKAQFISRSPSLAATSLRTCCSVAATRPSSAPTSADEESAGSSATRMGNGFLPSSSYKAPSMAVKHMKWLPVATRDEERAASAACRVDVPVPSRPGTGPAHASWQRRISASSTKAALRSAASSARLTGADRAHRSNGPGWDFWLFRRPRALRTACATATVPQVPPLTCRMKRSRGLTCWPERRTSSSRRFRRGSEPAEEGKSKIRAKHGRGTRVASSSETTSTNATSFPGRLIALLLKPRRASVWIAPSLSWP